MARETRGGVLLGIATILCLVAVAGCNDSNNLVGPERTPTPVSPTPTPTPVPGPVNISGAWNGTLTPFDAFDCDHVPVRATFQQNGTTVDGVLETSTSGCVPSHMRLHGTLTGNTFTAPIVSSGPYAFDRESTATVTLTVAATVNIDLRNNHSADPIPGGTAILGR